MKRGLVLAFAVALGCVWAAEAMASLPLHPELGSGSKPAAQQRMTLDDLECVGIALHRPFELVEAKPILIYEAPGPSALAILTIDQRDADGRPVEWGTRVLTPKPAVSYVSSVSADGEKVLYGTLDETYCLLDTQSGESEVVFSYDPCSCPSADLSPDGERLLVGGGGSVVIRTLATGQETDLCRMPDIGGVLWAPDGSAALISSRGSIYWIPLSTRKPQRLTHSPEGFEDRDFSLSPDMKALAFVRQHWVFSDDGLHGWLLDSQLWAAKMDLSRGIVTYARAVGKSERKFHGFADADYSCPRWLQAKYSLALAYLDAPGVLRVEVTPFTD